MANEALMAALETWASQTAKIDSHSFGCAFHSSCNKSTGGNLSSRGEGCMMSYVGRRFSAGTPEATFRLMIVGLDHGRHGFASYRGRQQGVEADYVYNTNPFNDHYAGVVKTAAA